MKKLFASMAMVLALSVVSVFAAGNSNLGPANGSVMGAGVTGAGASSAALNRKHRPKHEKLRHPKPAKPLKHHK
ncbi:MAG TPA: hypothetical protein VLZ81_04955 [Blastocatellia bacterium]|nr:hypothetical protein [Blastocatellia bacterium]